MSSRFPPLRPYSRGDVVAQNAVEAAAFDGRAIRTVGIPQQVLMENAGRSAAAVLKRALEAEAVLGLVGSGNNGGDALVALRSLASWGVSVRAILVADRDPADPLLHGWPLDVVSDRDLSDGKWTAALRAADVIVDGILGTGARGAPRERQGEAIARLEAADSPVVALDVPSGIDASTGAVPGAAVRADLTVAFGAPKLGAMLHPARAHVGRHVVVEIGFPPILASEASAAIVTPAWARARLPVRSTDTHKNRVGRVLVVGGRAGMAGAVVLGARAAFATGAGLVRVCSVGENRSIVQATVPEAIYVDPAVGGALEEAVVNSDAVVVGPGLGTDAHARATLARVAGAGGCPLLFDADALNLVAEGALDLSEAVSHRQVLLTPHAGEMARLRARAGDAPRSEAVAEGGEDHPPSDTATAAARRFGCAVLLKGAPSMVAAPGRPLAIDTQSTSDLAVAGMGDTLAGVCAAMMAQGLDPATAGSVALYLSGRAAVLAGRAAGLTPSDVVRWLPESLVEPAAPHSGLDLPFVIFDADAAR